MNIQYVVNIWEILKNVILSKRSLLIVDFTLKKNEKQMLSAFHFSVNYLLNILNIFKAYDV